MSSIATTPVGDRAPFQRFAAGFGRASAVLSALALLVAVGMSVPSSWFDFSGGGEAAAPAYASSSPPRRSGWPWQASTVVTPLVASDVDPAQHARRPADRRAAGDVVVGQRQGRAPRTARPC